MSRARGGRHKGQGRERGNMGRVVGGGMGGARDKGQSRDKGYPQRKEGEGTWGTYMGRVGEVVEGTRDKGQGAHGMCRVWCGGDKEQRTRGKEGVCTKDG